MTGLEIITQAYENAGKPTTCDPTTVAGKALMVGAFNSEILPVVKFKKATRQLRTKYYRTKKAFKYVTYEADVSAIDSDETAITLDDVTGFPSDITEAIVKDSNGELRVVYDYDSTTPVIYIDEPFSTAPVATDTLTFYPVYFDLDADMSLRFVEVLEIQDVIDSSKLIRQSSNRSRVRWNKTISRPSMWYREGTRIYLDSPPDPSSDRFVFMVIYERMPEVWIDSAPSVPATDTGADIDLPDYYHTAMVWRLTYWVYQNRQEPQRAQTALNIWKDYMNSLQTPEDIEDQMYSANIEVKIL